MSTFSNRLTMAMDGNSITAAQLSRKTGLSEASISRYVAGSMEPKLTALLILADALNVTADWLSGSDDSYFIEAGNKELIMIYNALSLDGKNKVLEYAELLLDKERKDVQR